jgi:hypothetical protein
MIESVLDAGASVIAGRQIPIGGTGVLTEAPTLTPALLTAAALPINSTLRYALPVRGASAIDVVLRFSAVTATVPTVRIYKTLNDGQTEKMGPTGASAAVAFAAFANGVQQTASITTLRGERVVIVEITTGANAPTLDQAEYSTL